MLCHGIYIQERAEDATHRWSFDNKVDLSTYWIQRYHCQSHTQSFKCWGKKGTLKVNRQIVIYLDSRDDYVYLESMDVEFSKPRSL